MDTITLNSLKLKTWRQIEQVDIKFHNKLTIITGANGAGKTTLLNIINSHFNWGAIYTGTPKRNKITGLLKWFSDFWEVFSRPESQMPNDIIIGEISYTNSMVSTISVPSNHQVYSIQIHPPYQVKGLHIPSHRSVYSYSAITQMPTQPILSQQAFSNYHELVKGSYFGGNSRKPNYVVKETLLSLATFGYGNEVVLPNPLAKQLFERFQEVLKLVLPPRLGFQKIKIEMPEVLFITKSGEFTIDGVSGGIASIIDIVWQIFMFEVENKNFVVTIDEPENHLHPEMQQTLLKGLIDAFPNVQFVVATHNPFIITSVPDSNVYVLDYNQSNKVESRLLDFINKSGTANEILREVLGLPFTMPIWAERKLQEIIKKYSEFDITDESLEYLRKDLSKIGLEDSVPDAISKIIESQEEND